MTLKRKILIKELLEYQSATGTLANKRNDWVIKADTIPQEEGKNSISFVNQVLDEFCSNSKLQKDIEVSFQKKTSSSLKLEELKQLIMKKEKENQIQEQKYLVRTKLHDLYKQNLELELKPVSGSGEKHQLLFSFKNISASNPDEIYSFVLVMDGSTYSVINCLPPIEGMEGLLKDLNDGNDLSLFVILVKRRYLALSNTKAMCNGHH